MSNFAEKDERNLVMDDQEIKLAQLHNSVIAFILPMICLTILCFGMSFTISYFWKVANTSELSMIHWYMLQLLLAFYLFKRNAPQSAYSSFLLESILSSIALLILLGALKWAFLMILICTFGILLAAIMHIYAKLGGKVDSDDDVPSEAEDDTITIAWEVYSENNIWPSYHKDLVWHAGQAHGQSF